MIWFPGTNTQACCFGSVFLVYPYRVSVSAKDFAGEVVGNRFDANQFLCSIMEALHGQFFCSAFSSILLASISVASISQVLNCKLQKSSPTFALKVYRRETGRLTFDGVWTHN